MVLVREPASFWRENVVAVVIIEAAKTREQMLEGDNFAIGRGRNLLHIQYVRRTHNLENGRWYEQELHNTEYVVIN